MWYGPRCQTPGKTGFESHRAKSYRPRTTKSRHKLGDGPNLLKGREAPASINEVWAADITYIPLRGGRFGYLSVLMDLYSRRIVGFDSQESMTADLVLASLRKAIRTRQPRAHWIHHSDPGGQYATADCRAVLRRAQMRQSTSDAENCYDYAFMESCFGRMNTELELAESPDSLEAVRELSSYITDYNQNRRHSSLGDLTPAEFESR
ncbi:MAG: IS3 family transposase [Planctomycetaceae bacterium]|nr:IS3 family transposase [Planctomycetaceae bacterium]